jgi:hypothetical protein
MVDMTAISQGLTSLRALTDLGKAMIDVRDAAAFRDKQIEFQGKIIDVQNALFTIQQERTELAETAEHLEKEIAQLKVWETEKDRYKLIEVGPGTFAYVVSPDAQGDEPEHLLCPTCFQRTVIESSA